MISYQKNATQLEYVVEYDQKTNQKRLALCKNHWNINQLSLIIVNEPNFMAEEWFSPVPIPVYSNQDFKKRDRAEVAEGLRNEKAQSFSSLD